MARWEFPELADPPPEPLPPRDPSGPQWPEPREPVDEPAGQLALDGVREETFDAGVQVEAARRKERHPERYCAHARCLYQTEDEYCPKHRIREA